MSIYFITHGSWWFHSSLIFPIWIHSRQWRSTEPACERFEVRQVVAPKVCAPAFLTNTAYPKMMGCAFEIMWHVENKKIQQYIVPSIIIEIIYFNDQHIDVATNIIIGWTVNMYKISTSKMSNGQTGQTSVKPLLATWVIVAQPASGILLLYVVFDVLSHNHTLILILSWIRYYYILTNSLCALLLNQLETSDTHTSFYHHRPQQGLGATFPSKGKTNGTIWDNTV